MRIAFVYDICGGINVEKVFSKAQTPHMAKDSQQVGSDDKWFHFQFYVEKSSSAQYRDI